MRTGKLTAMLAALMLAACHHAPSTIPTLTIEAPPPPQSLGPAQGIDLATDTSDVLNEIQGHQIGFVARYYREPASRWPALSASEAQRLSSMGVRIVAVYEPLIPDPGHFTYSSGYDDATAAYQQARAVGQPAGSAIYFAVDFDARTLEPIEDYFRGVAAGLAAASGGTPEYEVGVYGSGAVCEAIKSSGLARYSWLSNSLAWAGSGDYGDWDIRQGERMPELSFDHDSDEAKDNYGGFAVATQDTAAPYAGAVPDVGPAPGEVRLPGAPPQGRQLTSAAPPGPADPTGPPRARPRPSDLTLSEIRPAADGMSRPSGPTAFPPRS